MCKDGKRHNAEEEPDSKQTIDDWKLRGEIINETRGRERETALTEKKRRKQSKTPCKYCCVEKRRHASMMVGE